MPRVIVPVSVTRTTFRTSCPDPSHGAVHLARGSGMTNPLEQLFADYARPQRRHLDRRDPLVPTTASDPLPRPAEASQPYGASRKPFLQWRNVCREIVVVVIVRQQRDSKSPDAV